MPKKTYVYPGKFHTSIRPDRKLWFMAKAEAARRGIQLIQLLELALRKELGLEGKTDDAPS